MHVLDTVFNFLSTLFEKFKMNSFLQRWFQNYGREIFEYPAVKEKNKVTRTSMEVMILKKGQKQNQNLF